MSALVDEPAPPPVDGLKPEEAFVALLEQAAAMGASDLFFACEETQVAVLVRHLGLMSIPLASLRPVRRTRTRCAGPHAQSERPRCKTPQKHVP